MAEAQNPAVNPASTEKTAAPTNRRGVGSARGTQRLKFSHELAKSNGLFIAHLEAVNLSKINISESSVGMPTFNGCEIPRLNLVFASNEQEASKRHYVTLSFTAVESTPDTIPNGKNGWQVERIFNYMKHILDVFVLKGRELTEEESAALDLTFVDFDENGLYVPVEVDKVIAAYQTLFENFAHMLNTGKDNGPVFVDKDKKFIPLWIKIIRNVKNKKGWTTVANGDMAFPTFVGEGVIEIWKQNTVPSIRLDVTRESIIPKQETTESKAPTIPGMNGMPSGGVGITDPMLNNFDISAEAGTDTPF